MVSGHTTVKKIASSIALVASNRRLHDLRYRLETWSSQRHPCNDTWAISSSQDMGQEFPGNALEISSHGLNRNHTGVQ